MAAGVLYHGYRSDRMVGTYIVTFSTSSGEYEYEMSKRDAEKVHWMKKFGSGRQIAFAKKRAIDWKKVKKAASKDGFAIRYWTPLDELYEKWEKLRDKYEPLGRRTFGWPKPEPTEGEWRYWAGGAWLPDYKSARIFDTEGSAVGAAKRHKGRGHTDGFEVVEMKRGRPARRGIKAKASTRFQRPENYDVSHKHGNYDVWAGGNDWEAGNSWMWVEQRDKRLWVQIDHSKNEGEGKEVDAKWNAHGLAAVDTWLEVAKDMARADHEADMAARDDGQKTWKWSGAIQLSFFADALKDKRMKGFVEAHGYENHVWQQAKVAQDLTELARDIIASDARKNFNLQQIYNKWNTKLFGGELPKLPLKWTRSRTMGGYVKQTYNRATREVTSKVLAISDYMALDEERFNSIMIHEMIHVWQGHMNIWERQRQGHGPQFLAKARELSAKAGFKITVTEDISGIDVSDDVESKPFVVLLIEYQGNKGWLLFTERVWKRKQVRFIGDLLVRAQSGYKFTIVESTDRQLLKLPTSVNVVGKRGMSWYKNKGSFSQDILSGGKVMREISSKQAPKFDDKKPRQMLTALSKFLVKRLGERFPDAKFTFEVKTGHDRMTKVDNVVAYVESNNGPGKIMTMATFENGELLRVKTLVDTGRGQKFIWGSVDKYPTTNTIMKALDKSQRVELQEHLFGASAIT